MIEKAYATADNFHKDQLRKSGEPYIIHPLCVAIILADMETVDRAIARVTKNLKGKVDNGGQLEESAAPSWTICRRI